jgi:sensor histidine kinase YesM
MDKKYTNRLFWILHISGWGLYFLTIVFMMKFKNSTGWESKFLTYLTYILGFLVTFGLRYFYRFLYKKSVKLALLPVYIAASVLLTTLIWYFSDVLISSFFWKEGKLQKILSNLSILILYKRNYVFIFLLTAWSALYFAVKYALDWQQEKKRSSEAMLLAQKAQMEMLRYQLNPHFLFNSLNSIRALVDEDKKLARDMITELSEFLRYSLLHKDKAFVPLQNELEAVKHYFSIEKKRFEEKLNIQYQISEDTYKCQVPSFLLHPLIENAVKYGMKTSEMPLRIKLTAKKTEYGLLLEICNSGKWIERTESDTHKEGTGTGLSNVEKRLSNAFGEDYRFETHGKEKLVCIKIEIKEDYLHA